MASKMQQKFYNNMPQFFNDLDNPTHILLVCTIYMYFVGT